MEQHERQKVHEIKEIMDMTLPPERFLCKTSLTSDKQSHQRELRIIADRGDKEIVAAKTRVRDGWAVQDNCQELMNKLFAVHDAIAEERGRQEIRGQIRNALGITSP